MMGKVVADKNLCSETANLSENIKSLVSINEKLTREVMLVKNVNNILGNRIGNLSKNEQYGRRNNVEITGVFQSTIILNSIKSINQYKFTCLTRSKYVYSRIFCGESVRIFIGKVESIKFFVLELL